MFSNTLVYMLLQNYPLCVSVNQYYFVKEGLVMFYYNTWMFCKCQAVLILNLKISPCSFIRRSSFCELFKKKILTSERDSGKKHVLHMPVWHLGNFMQIVGHLPQLLYFPCTSYLHSGHGWKHAGDKSTEYEVNEQCGRLGELPS